MVDMSRTLYLVMLTSSTTTAVVVVAAKKVKKKVCSVAVDFTGNHSFSMIIILLMMLIYLVYMEIFPHLHHHYKSMYNMFLEMVNPKVGVQNLT